MGCTPSKEGESSTEVNGPTKNRYIREERPSKSVVAEAVTAGQYAVMKGYESDPRCPLSERQLYSITKSWKAINREMVSTAVNMFVRLLEHEDIRSLFAAFKEHETISELRASKLFQEHAMMVISTIDEVIANLDDMDYVTALLTSTGQAHSIRFKDFKADNFWKVEDAFLWAVKDTLRDRYTISIENIYKVVIHYILTTLWNAFTDHREQKLKGESHTEGNSEKNTKVEKDISKKSAELDIPMTTEMESKNNEELETLEGGEMIHNGTELHQIDNKNDDSGHNIEATC